MMYNIINGSEKPFLKY